MARLAVVLTLLSIVSIVSVFGVPSNITDQVVPQPEVVLVPHEIPCSNDRDCNQHGVCINATVCQCNAGWIEGKDGNGVSLGPCSYEQSTKKSAFLFSLFLGVFGADWFYLSRKTAFYIVVGLVKLLFGVLTLFGTPAFLFGVERPKHESLPLPLRALVIFVNLFTVVWWVVDWARVLGDKFYDGNGMPLMLW